MTPRDVAVAGATGLVGQALVDLLDGHPWFRTAEVLASSRSAGRRYGDAVDWRLPGAPPDGVADLPLREVGPDSRARIVFSCLPSSVASELELRWVQRGRHVFTNAGSHRMDSRVPLLVPEVNEGQYTLVRGRDRTWEGTLVANPNCSVSGLVLALAPVVRRWRPERVFVTTLQAASGAGLEGLDAPDIPDNVLPRIPGEEEKLRTEPRKVLGRFRDGRWREAELEVVPSCHRVPVRHGHVLSVVVEGDRAMTPAAAREAWRGFEGSTAVRRLPAAPERPVRVHHDPDRPQPFRDRDADDGMSVHVGRIRGRPGRLVFTALVHNLVRGAAGAALLNAEYARALGGMSAPAGRPARESTPETEPARATTTETKGEER